MRTIHKVEQMIPFLPAKKRVAAYARVSSGKDAMLQSLSAQVSYYNKYIQSHNGWSYVGVYADEAVTGTKDNRAEFQRLIQDCRNGQIDMIITKSISRFARNTVTLLQTVRELKELGVNVYFEEQNINSLSSNGELMLTILASYAQEESLSVSENQKWRLRKNYKEGRSSNYFHIYGYEYNKGNLIVIPEESEVVRMIFNDYLDGMGRNAIMKKLIRLGIPAVCGEPWAENTISRMLRNEKYIGDMCLQKGFITDHITKRYKENKGELPKFYVEGSHEAIIDKKTFEAVQIEFVRRSTISKNHYKPKLNEFSGIIRCGRCGASYRRKINAAGTKYAKATWTCANYNNRSKAQCSAKRIPEDILKEKCAEALGLPEFSTEKFVTKITAITIPNDGILVFLFKDGTEQTLTWQNHSRRESWTDEMKAEARQKTLDNRRKR